MSTALLPELLKHFRHRRHLSQLALSLEVGTSTRHLSFIESGRAKPSEDLLLRLMGVLGLSLREQNELLRAAGFTTRFAEPAVNELPLEVEWALQRMLQQQEPYPMALLSADYDIVRCNQATQRVFAAFVADPSATAATPHNLFAMVFDPHMARPFVVDWPAMAHRMVARLYRETLSQPDDTRLSALLDRVLAYPDVNTAWCRPDLGPETGATLNLRLKRGDISVGFLTTLSSFSAPQMVTLEELRIESYFPLDEQTQRWCELWHKGSGVPADNVSSPPF